MRAPGSAPAAAGEVRPLLWAVQAFVGLNVLEKQRQEGLQCLTRRLPPPASPQLAKPVFRIDASLPCAGSSAGSTSEEVGVGWGGHGEGAVSQAPFPPKLQSFSLYIFLCRPVNGQANNGTTPEGWPLRVLPHGQTALFAPVRNRKEHRRVLPLPAEGCFYGRWHGRAFRQQPEIEKRNLPPCKPLFQPSLCHWEEHHGNLPKLLCPNALSPAAPEGLISWAWLKL